MKLLKALQPLAVASDDLHEYRSPMKQGRYRFDRHIATDFEPLAAHFAPTHLDLVDFIVTDGLSENYEDRFSLWDLYVSSLFSFMAAFSFVSLMTS